MKTKPSLPVLVRSADPLVNTMADLSAVLVGLPSAAELYGEFMSVYTLKKKPRQIKNTNLENTQAFVMMVCEEVERTFNMDQPGMAYLKGALARVRGNLEAPSREVIEVMIAVGQYNLSIHGKSMPSYERACATLADDLLELHSAKFNGTRLEGERFSDIIRRARDNAEAIGLPDMSVIEGFFTLLFK